MSKIIVNSEDNVNRIMKEADKQRKKREIYKILKKKNSIFDLPFINHDRSPGKSNMFQPLSSTRKSIA